MTKTKLLNDYKLPAFKYLELEALFDTGAYISVCTLSRAVFELMFPNNFKYWGEGAVQGFGGEAKGDLYQVISTEIAGVKFNNVNFFIPHEPTIDFKFVITGTLFKDCPYTIDMVNHELQIHN